ncbi:ATP-binding protein [Amycolatopsis sp. NBC_01286]|uniref:ATP-binding protein n=1 Tax=Amycolatopsis sp. NBC_01286 TaxID=2903560 RepID=UPI002E14EFC3|nr:ATP-binding protein [Amycolatopsis sp. NBC_01286]
MRSLEPDKDFSAFTTYKLIRPIEWVAPLLQATNMVTSIINDKYLPYGRTVMVGLAVLHIALAIFSVCHRGSLTRGGAWPAAWAASMLVMPLILVHLIAPGDYGSTGVGFQMGGYAMITLAVFAFHPWWIHFPNRLTQWSVQVTLVLIVAFEPLLLVGSMRNWELDAAHYKSALVHAIWVAVWYAVGMGIGALCRIAVEGEREALLTSFREALLGLHNIASTAAIRIESGEDARQVAREFKAAVNRRQRRLLTKDARISVASILSDAIEMFGTALRVPPESPGMVSLHRDTAIPFEDGLHSLLKNIVVHGGGVGEVEFETDGHLAVLSVRDCGPGFNESRLDDEGGNLFLIRQNIRKVGGELRKLPSENGSVLQLTVPFNPSR